MNVGRKVSNNSVSLDLQGAANIFPLSTCDAKPKSTENTQDFRTIDKNRPKLLKISERLKKIDRKYSRFPNSRTKSTEITQDFRISEQIQPNLLKISELPNKFNRTHSRFPK